MTDDFDATQISLLHGSRVSLAIDDLGPGDLLLKHLFVLPISAVKLDVGSLPGLPLNPRSRAVATAIIRMAQALGLDVVAERVESEHQAAFLRPRCAALQGFHAAAPMSADELTAWLGTRMPQPRRPSRRAAPRCTDRSHHELAGHAPALTARPSADR